MDLAARARADAEAYYVGEVDVAGVTFRQRFMHDSNGLHDIAVGPKVTKRVPRPWWRGGGHRKLVRENVRRIGDLDGFLSDLRRFARHLLRQRGTRMRRACPSVAGLPPSRHHGPLRCGAACGRPLPALTSGPRRPPKGPRMNCKHAPDSGCMCHEHHPGLGYVDPRGTNLRVVAPAPAPDSRELDSRDAVDAVIAKRRASCAACGGNADQCQRGTGTPHFRRLSGCTAYGKDGTFAVTHIAPRPRQPWEPRPARQRHAA